MGRSNRKNSEGSVDGDVENFIQMATVATSDESNPIPEGLDDTQNDLIALKKQLSDLKEENVHLIRTLHIAGERDLKLRERIEEMRRGLKIAIQRYTNRENQIKTLQNKIRSYQSALEDKNRAMENLRKTLLEQNQDIERYQQGEAFSIDDVVAPTKEGVGQGAMQILRWVWAAARSVTWHSHGPAACGLWRLALLEEPPPMFDELEPSNENVHTWKEGFDAIAKSLVGHQLARDITWSVQDEIAVVQIDRSELWMLETEEGVEGPMSSACGLIMEALLGHMGFVETRLSSVTLEEGKETLEFHGIVNQTALSL